MAETSSGRMLREARERKGLEINVVARRLRIRPDILHAIEEGDFEAMPPRGYTRNMVNAYAHLVGLNPTVVVNAYLDELHDYQMQRSRAMQLEQFDMGRAARPRRASYDDDRTTRSHLRREREQREEREQNETNRHRSYLTRDLYDNRTPYSRDDYGVARPSTNRPNRSSRDYLSHHSGYESSDFNIANLNRWDTGDRSKRDTRQWGSSYSRGYGQNESTLSRIMSSRLTIIIIAAIILVIIIALIASAISARNSAANSDVSTLPVSGISDTTSSDESDTTSSESVAPTSATVVYSVETSGAECYVEIYTDGVMSAEMLTGPVSKTVDVTGTWVITTYVPENLTVTVDGEKVTLESDSNYNGMYSYTVDFPAILEQWQSEHSSSSGTTSSSSTTSSTKSTSSSTSTSTTSTGSTSTSTSNS